MSNRADDLLRELTFLAALDSVQAEVDTSAIPEIQDWSGAVAGKFYGATAAVSRPGSTLHTIPGNVSYAELSDSQLVSLCLSANDMASWGEFVRRCEPRIRLWVFRFARRMGDTSRELVDDLTQEVFLKLCTNDFQALKRFEPRHEQAIYGLLSVMAANVARDYFRSAASAKRGGALDEKYAIFEALASTAARGPSAAIEKGILFAEVDQILQKAFSERDRAIFWLHYRDGLNAQDISQRQELGLTVEGIRTLLWRMSRRIKKIFDLPASDRKALRSNKEKGIEH